ncbi:MAG: MerR family transcriptional regulator [Eggerthellaceae bacterium]|nr:MerR family transcriptional regulator [Eggerthellaceae bacterium]
MDQSSMLRSGEFAKRAGVTKKALQVYMDKGILLPDYIDRENGYRYYAVERSAQLDEIIKMREVGLSLDEIKDIIDQKDSLHYLDILYARLEEVDRNIEALEQNRAVLQARIDNQSMFLNPPALRHCFVEYQPRRMCVRYRINPYRGTKDSGEAWQDVLDMVRQSFHDNNIPFKYFSNIGATFDMNELSEGRIVYNHAIVTPESDAVFPHVEYLPAGYYATMYDQRYMSDGDAIARAVSTLMSFVNAHGYQTCGDYIQNCVAETTMFDFNLRMLYVVKEQVPIKLDSRSADLKSHTAGR